MTFFNKRKAVREKCDPWTEVWLEFFPSSKSFMMCNVPGAFGPTQTLASEDIKVDTRNDPILYTLARPSLQP